MYGINHPERIKLNNQIREWNLNRLDLFQISEPNEDLEFYGVMRYFYQGDDLKYQTKCLRVSSTATTLDVIAALIVKFHPDAKMINNDKYILYENHNIEDRRMKNNEHPLIVQLNWASDDKDGKFILKNESRRRRSTDVTNHSILLNYGMSRSTSTLTNGFENQTLRTQSSAVYSSSSNFFSRRFSNSKKNKIKTKADKVTFQDAEEAKRLAEERSGKPPESSFTRTISNPDDVMKRRRQKKLEFRLEQFSGIKGDGEIGGTLKIYGDSINPDIPYKTLLLSVNDTAEKVLLETLDKYGISPDEQRFYVLVQQNIPSRENRNRSGNVEELILHNKDCPLGILVHSPPKQGFAIFAVRRAMKTDKFPISARMPPRSVAADSALTNQKQRNYQPKESSSSLSVDDNSEFNADYPLLRKLLVDTDGTLYDDDRGLFSLSSLNNQSTKNTKSYKKIRIGSQFSEVGHCPNILLSSELYDDIRPLHCHITCKLDPQSMCMNYLVTPNLDSSNRTPRPCKLFVNQQRIDKCTQIFNGDIIQLGQSVIFRFEEFDDETISTTHSRALDDDVDQTTFENASGSMNISYYTSELPITVKYKYKRSEQLIDDIMKLSKEYAEKGSKELFSNSIGSETGYVDDTFRLCPAYMIYLVMRAGLVDDQQISQLIDLISNYIERAINDDRSVVEKQIFWLSNTSELLHLLQYDIDLRHYSATAQDVLAGVIDNSFSIIQEQFSKDLMILLPALLSEDDLDIDDNTQEDNIPCLDRASVLNLQGGIDFPIQHLLQTLSLAFNLFHNCQVNVALTIQMFSQLFHLLNTWLFNSVLGEQTSINDNGKYTVTVSQEWGNRLIRRLNRILYWSEINGLEMAANCHLQKMFQVAELMKADKRDLSIFGEKCIEMVNLNGAQLHHLLINCQDYDLPDAWIEVVVNTAIQLHEQNFNDTADANVTPQIHNTLPLYDDMDLRLPLLLPADGYCCDRGIVSCPTDLSWMLQSIKNNFKYRCNPPIIEEMDSRWKAYLVACENTPTISRSNTIEKSPTSPVKSNSLQLPRNWVSNSVHSEEVSTSETLSSSKDRLEKTISITSQSSSQYSGSHDRHSLPNAIKPRNGLIEPSTAKGLFELKLMKIDNSLGLSISAVKAMGSDIFRIYVKDVIVGGAGHKSGMIFAGDQLVSIDGNLLEDMTQEEAVVFMKKTKQEVTLLIDKSAAQRHGVMEAIIQAKSAKNSSASQKSTSRQSNAHPPPLKKPLSTANSFPKNHSLKDDPTKLSFLPPPPPPPSSTKVPSKPLQAAPLNSLKPTANMTVVSHSANPDYSSLPIRDHKSGQPVGAEIRHYGTVSKVQTPKVKFESDNRSASVNDTKISLSNSHPNLSASQNRKLPQNNSSSESSSSSSLSSSEDEESLTSLSQPSIQNMEKRNSSSVYERIPKQQQQQKQLINLPAKSMSDMNIKANKLGIPRHEILSSETELQSTIPTRQVFSRPNLSQNCDSRLNVSTEDESEPISLNKPVSLCHSSSSESESETISSHTRSSSPSDSSPQPDIKRRITPEPNLIPESKRNLSPQLESKQAPDQERKLTPDLPQSDVIKHDEFVLSENKIQPGVKNLGGFKPIKLTNPKSEENVTIERDVNNGHTIPDVVNSDKYKGGNTIAFDVSKTPSEEEIKLRRKVIEDNIRQQTEEKERKSKAVEIQPSITTPAENCENKRISTQYGRPQFNTSSTIPLVKSESNNTNTEFKLPSPPSSMTCDGLVVPPSPIIQSKRIAIGSENHQTENSVEELSFRDKMKLFATKIGENDVIERQKFSRKQQKIESGDYS